MISVLYVHNTAEISGGERSLLALWERLDRSQVQPFLAVPGEGALTARARDLGVTVCFWSAPALRPWNIFSILGACSSLARIVKEWNISILHSYSPRNNVLAALVGKPGRVPVIWHERNLIYGGERDISAWLANWPSAIICNSAAVARRFAREGKIPARVAVVYNGVDTDRFQPADLESAKQKRGLSGRKVVGLVSNLNRRKNVDGFLKIARALALQDPSLMFLVVGGSFGPGDASRRQELEAEAKGLGLSGRVEFTDFQDDVRPYLAAMDVYCSVTEKEACSRALLEAMAMGKPCVALRDGGNPELIEDGISGRLVGLDEGAFSGAVAQLLHDRQERERIGREARGRVISRFSLKRQADETQALYCKLREE